MTLEWIHEQTGSSKHILQSTSSKQNAIPKLSTYARRKNDLSMIVESTSKNTKIGQRCALVHIWMIWVTDWLEYMIHWFAVLAKILSEFGHLCSDRLTDKLTDQWSCPLIASKHPPPPFTPPPLFGSIRECQTREIDDGSETLERGRRYRERFVNEGRAPNYFRPIKMERRCRPSPNQLCSTELSLTMSKSKRERIQRQERNEDVFRPNDPNCNM